MPVWTAFELHRTARVTCFDPCGPVWFSFHMSNNLTNACLRQPRIRWRLPNLCCPAERNIGRTRRYLTLLTVARASHDFTARECGRINGYGEYFLHRLKGLWRRDKQFRRGLYRGR